MCDFRSATLVFCHANYLSLAKVLITKGRSAGSSLAPYRLGVPADLTVTIRPRAGRERSRPPLGRPAGRPILSRSATTGGGASGRVRRAPQADFAPPCSAGP